MEGSGIVVYKWGNKQMKEQTNKQTNKQTRGSITLWINVTCIAWNRLLFGHVWWEVSEPLL